MPDPIAPFGLVSTKRGPMIVNRNDYHLSPDGTKGYGVGFQLMNKGEYDPEEMRITLDLLQARLDIYGPEMVVVDCGANIGIFTVAWANALSTYGTVYAFEAQEKIFYALAGNVILRNCLNAHVRHAAVGSQMGTLSFPEPDYTQPASFGSFELVKRPVNEDIGQPLNYDKPTLQVPMLTVDSLNLARLDFLKIDVEGMEFEVLNGALDTIKRCKPQLFVELFKSDASVIKPFLKNLGYNRQYGMGLNTLFLHDSDPLVIEIAPEAKTNVH